MGKYIPQIKPNKTKNTDGKIALAPATLKDAHSKERKVISLSKSERPVYLEMLEKEGIL